MARTDCVTTIGLQRIASALAAQPVFTHLAVGDGDDPAMVGDLALENEIYRVPFDAIVADAFAVRGEVIITATDIGVGVQDVKEAASQNAALGGEMLCRHVLETLFQFSGNQKLSVVHCIVAV